ncbi:hypothetical protein B0H11DRAFT_1924686 [Mycena galericulata]|nr:hypothetical protein B0H11DRAFT_1924686 [Mycena galericulata]
MLAPVRVGARKSFLRCLEVVEDDGDGPFVNVAALLMELMKRNGSRHLAAERALRSWAGFDTPGLGPSLTRPGLKPDGRVGPEVFPDPSPPKPGPSPGPTRKTLAGSLQRILGSHLDFVSGSFTGGRFSPIIAPDAMGSVLLQQLGDGVKWVFTLVVEYIISQSKKQKSSGEIFMNFWSGKQWSLQPLAVPKARTKKFPFWADFDHRERIVYISKQTRKNIVFWMCWVNGSLPGTNPAQHAQIISRRADFFGGWKSVAPSEPFYVENSEVPLTT